MKKVMFLVSTVAIVASGCSSKVQQVNLLQTSVKLEKNKIIYIEHVTDGVFDGKTYTGSGQIVQNYFLINLRPYAAKVTMGSEGESRPEKVDYVVKPTIVHWEPRQAYWSGKPTRVNIQVSVSDAVGKEIINNQLIVKGRSLTYASQTAEGLAEYLIKLFCNGAF